MDRMLTDWMNRLLRRLLRLRGLGRYVHQLFARLLPVHRVTVRGVPIKCVTPLHQVGTYREALSWGEREPEVLDWIDGFAAGSVFFDVGANFGTESLYAALKPGGPSRIVAFDAEMLGSYNLAANLLLNGVEKVDNHVVAVGATTGLVRLGENLNYIHVDGSPAKYRAAAKTLMQVSLDDFVGMAGVSPTHVKIDVDGPELGIVQGMRGILAGTGLKSLMIEINSDDSGRRIREILAAAGFVERPHLHRNQHNVIFERAA